MNSKDIKHLANLSRLHLTDEEVDAYTKQFDEIVAYVDKIKEFSSNNEIPDQVRDDVPVNVMREDKVNSYPQPENIVNEAPDHQDNFIKVKKILNQ
ncbi:MAG: glutamyl-tRNA(Gln) amidotransferase, subunit [Candidatus Parcubacteria bacterium]|jgi:aspartyl-tRNA(Asn)/glutamyl-tRNA(Gln) amidotransferase subunit C